MDNANQFNNMPQNPDGLQNAPQVPPSAQNSNLQNTPPAQAPQQNNLPNASQQPTAQPQYGGQNFQQPVQQPVLPPQQNPQFTQPMPPVQPAQQPAYNQQQNQQQQFAQPDFQQTTAINSGAQPVAPANNNWGQTPPPQQYAGQPVQQPLTGQPSTQPAQFQTSQQQTPVEQPIPQQPQFTQPQPPPVIGQQNVMPAPPQINQGLPLPMPQNSFVQPAPFMTEEVVVEAASISERLLAYVIDLFPFSLLAWIMIYFQTRVGGADYTPELVVKWHIIFISLYVCYMTIALSGRFNSVGKALLGIRVVSADGAPLRISQSFMRAIGYFISAAPMQLGFALAFITDKHRALHDLFARTMVIRTRDKSEGGYTLIFILSWVVFFIMAVSNYAQHFVNISADDAKKIELAQIELNRLEVLEVLHRQQYGAYTNNINKLAPLSGSPAKLQEALKNAFEPGTLKIAYSDTAYYIAGIAKDSKKTPVVKEGNFFKKPELPPLPKEQPSEPETN